MFMHFSGFENWGVGIAKQITLKYLSGRFLINLLLTVISVIQYVNMPVLWKKSMARKKKNILVH
jgi:hypothetical protein